MHIELEHIESQRAALTPGVAAQCALRCNHTEAPHRQRELAALRMPRRPRAMGQECEK